MRVPGRLCLVLHTHLPWVPHFGTWPVGEEWLHQAFTRSWRPVVRVLERLAEEGRREVLTLGVTPVVAAMLDDPYALRQLHTWVGGWQIRALELHGRGDRLAELARFEYAAATECLEDVETRWSRGASAVLAPLVRDRVVELLGGPTTHPFLPILDERYAAASLASGLEDATLRLGHRPTGIWSPECGYRPGLEHLFARAGVDHLVLDSAAFDGETALARPLGASGVVAFGRDLEVTDRVWSARTGYPVDPDYRDFHAFDHASGFRPFRVTGLDVPDSAKAVWCPEPAADRIAEHAADFLAVAARRLERVAEETGRPGVVVAAWDTELFGHWWHEGPQWLEAVLRSAPEAGVELSTLAGAMAAGYVGAPLDTGPTSWGEGKDFRLWAGPHVGDLKAKVDRAVARVLDLSGRHAGPVRSLSLDQLLRETHLLAASDWTFMVSRDSAAAYARDRVDAHAAAAETLADLVETLGPWAPETLSYVRERRNVSAPFGHLDARLLPHL